LDVQSLGSIAYIRRSSFESSLVPFTTYTTQFQTLRSG
jgi:hypothetical protein